MKKYIPVFGDQSMFENAPLDCVVCIKADREYTYYLDGNKSNLTGRIYSEDGHFFIAMRRIVEETPKAEPKRWTVEDQKTGRLPEVGWVVTTYDTKRYVFVGESCHENQWSLRDAESGKVYHTPITWVLPLETPEEKAQRLRDEWCSECTYKYYHRGHKGFPEMIYDALLSGELTMPGKVDE